MDNEITEEVVEEETYVESTDLELSETSEEDSEEKATVEKPAWLEADETVPLTALLKTKRKLKGQIEEANVENEELKARIHKLESSVQQPIEQTIKRPRERDFETDEAYEAEVDRYEAARDADILNRATQTNTQQSQQDQVQQNIGRSLDTHYSKAEDLCKQHSIDLDVYKAADSNVRQAVEAVRPRQGNSTVDFLIHKLGAESEKVFLKVGNNKALLAEFQSTLVNDPSGMETAVFLGAQKEAVKLNKKRSSSAPKPAVHVNGDKIPPAKASAEKKKYDKAEGQAAYNIRKAAKAAGIDTKEW